MTVLIVRRLLLPVALGSFLVCGHGHTAVEDASTVPLEKIVNEEATKAFGADVFKPHRRFDQPVFFLGHTVPTASSKPDWQPTVFHASCAQHARWRIYWQASETGGVNVGICRKSELTRTQLQSAGQALRETAATLQRMSVPGKTSLSGWAPQFEVLADGTELDYFVAMLVGHGVLLYPTLVLTARDVDRVVIVQLDGSPLCDPNPKARVCTDQKAALRDLAQGVAARVKPQP